MKPRLANKSTLKKINDEAIARKYNRTIEPAGIDRLDDEAIFAIAPIMIHEHAQGVAVEPHFRCSVQMVYPAETPWGGLMLDTPIELFNMLHEPPAPVPETV